MVTTILPPNFYLEFPDRLFTRPFVAAYFKTKCHNPDHRNIDEQHSCTYNGTAVQRISSCICILIII
jgi:hypothetical protein